MNKRPIVAIFAGVGLAAAIILIACRPSPGYQATSLPASQSPNYTLNADRTSGVEGLPTFQPSTTYTITLDIHTYDPAFPPLAGGPALSADVPSAVEGAEGGQPSPPRAGGTEGGRDVPAHAIFELPTDHGRPVRTHYLGPHFTVQVPAERPIRFTIHAPGYAPVDKVMVPHYQRDAHLSMEIPLTPAGLPEADAQILVMMREAVEGIDYGFAPLLLDPSARVVILPSPASGRGDGGEGQVAYLTYPTQPADPLNWPTMDCFAFAYAVRRHLLSEFPDDVADVALALVELPSTLGDDYTSLTARHVYAWVTFTDSHVATLDLTPLAAEPVNPRHTPIMLVNHAAGLEIQFDAWRRRVSLRKAQPMLTVERSGTLYTLLAGVNVLADEYQFTLRAYETQPALSSSWPDKDRTRATGNQSLEFIRGALAGLRFKRADFPQVQGMVESDGPDTFRVKSHLVIRKGDPDPTLAAVLDDHLSLLWHLVTKLQEPGP
jgi:hypothetical protein